MNILKLTGLERGILLERENRFLARVRLGEEIVRVHVPNPGRMQEMFVPDAGVWIRDASKGRAKNAPPRKTSHDLVLVEYAGTLVSADTRLPNQLMAEAVESGQIMAEDGPWATVRREVTLGHSRFDLFLEAEGRRRWVEVKSVTLVEEGRALFPDAPTVRGAKHLTELAHLAQGDDEAAVAFVVQRDDARSMAPHVKMDARFAEALRAAIQAGVMVKVYTCHVSTTGLEIVGQLPLETEWMQEL